MNRLAHLNFSANSIVHLQIPKQAFDKQRIGSDIYNSHKKPHAFLTCLCSVYFVTCTFVEVLFKFVGANIIVAIKTVDNKVCVSHNFVFYVSQSFLTQTMRMTILKEEMMSSMLKMHHWITVVGLQGQGASFCVF